MSNQTSQFQSRHEFESNLIAKTWQNEVFKQELLANPKAVYGKELEQTIPDSVEIKVLEENSNTIYLVLPKKPEVSEELSEEALESVAGGRWCILICGD
ncbi:NHLP leader peptide family RiPP precursor [Nostoc sp. CHAB 5824]|nr:NHLP leader peptide family RiPP precursor [Nostoc sp. CHAB 5824]